MIRQFLIALVKFVLLMFTATLVLAEMPRELKGTWILDVEATELNMKASPEMKPEDEKYIPTILKRMSQYQWNFDEGVIESSRGSKKQALSVSLEESDKNKVVFKGRLNDQAIIMTVVFVSDKVINILSSATDDLNYYLWTRGSLDSGAQNNDGSLAIELMEKSLNNSTGKPESMEPTR